MRTEITKRHINSRICQYCGVKTYSVTPSFYYVFTISLSCDSSMLSFIGNLLRVLLQGNYISCFTNSFVNEEAVCVDSIRLIRLYLCVDWTSRSSHQSVWVLRCFSSVMKHSWRYLSGLWIFKSAVWWNLLALHVRAWTNDKCLATKRHKHCLVTKHFTVWTPCLVLFDRVWWCLIVFGRVW